MNPTIVKQKSIRGFLPTTYAVFDGERLIKLCTSIKEAQAAAAALCAEKGDAYADWRIDYTE